MSGDKVGREVRFCCGKQNREEAKKSGSVAPVIVGKNVEFLFYGDKLDIRKGNRQ